MAFFFSSTDVFDPIQTKSLLAVKIKKASSDFRIERLISSPSVTGVVSNVPDASENLLFKEK